MRIKYIIFLLLILPISSVAQDVIVKKDGTKIEAKVIEISPTSVRYRNFTQPEGPDRMISTSSLKEIVYEDGQFDDFSKIEEQSVPTKVAPVKNPRESKKENDPLLSSGFFIDGLIGYAELTREDYGTGNYIYDPYGNLIYVTQVSKSSYLSLALRLGTKWYFGQREKWRPGLQVNWLRLNMYLDTDNPESLIIGPKNLSFCNIGMANIIKFNDNMGLELNFTTGLNTGIDLDYGRFDVGIAIAPEVKFRLKNIAIGLDYSRVEGLVTVGEFRPDTWNQISLSIGAKF